MGSPGIQSIVSLNCFGNTVVLISPVECKIGERPWHTLGNRLENIVSWALYHVPVVACDQIQTQAGEVFCIVCKMLELLLMLIIWPPSTCC